MKKIFYLFLIIFVLIISSFLFLNKTKANTLGEGYLFFERMQVSTATDMTVMFTPGSNFTASEAISFRIIFPEDTAGTWCKVNEGTFTITGTTTSPIDQGSWDIGAALPGTLVATCYQGSEGSTDYIEVTGIEALTSGTSYGFTLDSNITNFVTGANSGSNLISFQLIEGSKVETLSFSINLLADDQLIVSAEVLSASTITCTIENSLVNIGVLYKGGMYTTGHNYLTTNSTNSFYWAVYGEGGGLSGEAGLYNSEGSGYLISSAGVDGQVDLGAGEGFGMLVDSFLGQVTENFIPTTLGIFGAVGKGIDGTSLFLAVEDPVDLVSVNVHYGARAGVDALDGTYEETLTYICGTYIGEGLLFPLELGNPEIYEGDIYNDEWFKGVISLRSSITDQKGEGFDTTSCEVSINDEAWTGMDVTYSSGYCQYNNYTPNADFNIRFRIQDNATNLAESNLGIFTYDNTAPTTTATITSPAGGTAYTCGNFTAENVRAVLSCADNVGGSGCEATYPKYCTDANNTCIPATSYSTNVDITTEGTTYIRYFSSDNLTNNEIVQSCEIKIDKSAPEITFTNNSTSNSYYNATTFAAVTNPVKAQDSSNSGLKTFRYAWTNLATDPTGINSTTCTGGTAVTVTEGTLLEVLSAASVNRPTTSSDSHYFHACATDVVGNITKNSSRYYLDVDPPTGGSVNNHNGFQTSTTIAVTVNRGTDAHSGMSETNSDYLLEYQSATLTNSTGACGTYGSWTNANVTETAIATSYNFTGTASNCYKFRYTVKDKVSNTSTFTGTDVTKIDTTAPAGGSFVINNDDARTNTTVVTLNVTCPSDGWATVQMAYGNSASPTNWVSCSSTASHTLASGDGTKTVYMRFRDGGLNTTSDVTDTIILDTTAPINGSFVINNNDTYTTSQTGNTLNVTCPTDSWTPIQMAYGNATDPTTPWDTCAATVSNYSLTAGDGTKTVYMKFRDGGVNTTSNLTDTIILDTVDPSIAASNASATWYSTERTATVSAIDATSGIAEVRYNWGSSSVLNSNCDTLGTATSNGEILSAPSGGTTLYLCARDNAGRTNTWSGEYNWKYEQSTAVTTGGCTSTIWGTDCTVTAAGGDGTGSYEFDWVFGDNCGINSTTGVVSSTGAGTCVVRARRLSDNNYYTSSWSDIHYITVNKQEQSAPTAPTCSTVTENSVTITACTGCEYRMGTGTAQGSTLFTGLSASTTYTFSSRYVATADYNVSPWSSNVSCTTLDPCGGDTSITDSRDAQSYNIVEIGTQCWMAKNLAYLPSVVGPATGSTTIPYYYVYGYTGTDVSAAKATDNYTTYGVLYNWPAAMDGDIQSGDQGICPTGWHLPSDVEQHTLEAYLATEECEHYRTGYSCDPAGSKMATFTVDGDNSSGFTALAAGFRHSNGLFYYIGTTADFWSSTAISADSRARGVDSSSSRVYRAAYNRADGISVRCLRN